MSARAAWRLEQLGFTDVYDYVASKIDWFANGLPREGNAANASWAGDLRREDVPTCAADDVLGAVRERVVASGYDVCIVVNPQRIVLGLLRGEALGKDADVTAGDVMELGPKTIRPHNPVKQLLQLRSNEGGKSWIVSTSHGKLLGLLLRTDAEQTLTSQEAA